MLAIPRPPPLPPSFPIFSSLSLSPFSPLLPSSSHDPPAHFDHATNNANQTAAASADQPTFEEGKHFWPSLLLPSGQGPSLRRYMAPRNANDGAAFTNLSSLVAQFRNIEVHYSKIKSFFIKQLVIRYTMYIAAGGHGTARVLFLSPSITHSREMDSLSFP